MFFAREDMAIR